MPGAHVLDRQTGAARPAARQACPARSCRPDRPADPATGAGRGRSRSARRRAGARLSARAVRRAGPGGGSRLCRGALGSLVGRWPCRLDRAPGRSVRAGTEHARPAVRAPDRGSGRCPRRASLGARGSAAQPGPRRRAGRGRSPEPDPEPAAAAGRRGQGGDRVFAAPAGAKRRPDRSRDPLADHRAAPQRPPQHPRCRQHRGTAVGLATLAGRAGPLSRRPYRHLGDRLARGRFS